MVSDLLLGDRWPIAESAADAAIAVVRQKRGRPLSPPQTDALEAALLPE